MTEKHRMMMAGDAHGRAQGYLDAVVHLIRPLVFLCVLAACAPTPKPGPCGAATSPSPQEEACLGAAAAPRLAEFYGGVYDDQPLNTYVQEIASRIAHASEQPDRIYKVAVLDTPVINAFALAGGYIYVTRGMLALINDEAELAAVLGHEIAHLVAGHSMERRQAALNISVLGAMLQQSAKAQAKILAQGRAQLADYTRAQELEADRLARHYLAGAGYDPLAAADILYGMEGEKRLEKRTQKKSDGSLAWMASHPSTPDRVQAARDMSDITTTGNPGERNRNDYLAAIDGMVYGDRPAQGIVLGQTFLHAGLRISFKAPEGFRIRNLPGVVAIDDDEGALARFQADRFAQTGEGAFLGTEEYIRDKWASNAALSNIVEFRVAGLPAVSADAHFGAYDLRFIALRVSPELVYRFLLATKGTAGRDRMAHLDDMVRHFRMISAEEATAVKTRHIRIVPVGPRDTPGRLAARMKVENSALERFRMLNGLERGDKLHAGQRVKLIAE